MCADTFKAQTRKRHGRLLRAAIQKKREVMTDTERYFGDKPHSLRAVSDQRATRAGLSFNYRSLRPAVPFLPEGLSPERPVMHKHFDAGSGTSGDGPCGWALTRVFLSVGRTISRPRVLRYLDKAVA